MSPRIDPRVKQALPEVEKRRKEEREIRERGERLDARLVKELNDELDFEEKRAANPLPPKDPLTALRDRLDQERRDRELVATGTYRPPPLPPYAGIRAMKKSAMRREREWQRLKEREDAAGVTKARERWDRQRALIGENFAKELAAEDQRHAAEIRAIGERRDDELERLGPEPSLALLEAQKLEVPS